MIFKELAVIAQIYTTRYSMGAKYRFSVLYSMSNQQPEGTPATNILRDKRPTF